MPSPTTVSPLLTAIESALIVPHGKSKFSPVIYGDGVCINDPTMTTEVSAYYLNERMRRVRAIFDGHNYLIGNQKLRRPDSSS